MNLEKQDIKEENVLFNESKSQALKCVPKG